MTQKPQTYVRVPDPASVVAKRQFWPIYLLAFIALGIGKSAVFAQSGQHFISFENGAVLKLSGTWNYRMGDQSSQHQQDERTFRFLADNKTLLTGIKPVRQGPDGSPAPASFSIEASYSALRMSGTKTRIHYRDNGDNWLVDLDFGSETRGSYSGEVRLDGQLRIEFRGTFILEPPSRERERRESRRTRSDQPDTGADSREFIVFEPGTVLRLNGTWSSEMIGQETRHEEDSRVLRFLADQKVYLSGVSARMPESGFPISHFYRAEAGYSALRLGLNKTRITYRDDNENWQIDLDFGSPNRGSYTGEVRLSGDTKIEFRGTFSMNQP